MRIAVSMGDPRGVGPEVILRALDRPLGRADHVVFGERRRFAELARRLHLPWPGKWVTWEECGGGDPGQAQVRALDAALDAVLGGRCQALVTAPIDKAAAMAAGLPDPGHTGYLARRTGTRLAVMMLAGPRLRVVPITGHLPLAGVADALTPDLVTDTLAVTAEALVRDLARPRPTIAQAALNPHAGESGALGDEEARVLAPAIEAARRRLDARGVPALIEGPSAADALFARRAFDVDAVVCCYHDQALIPLKLTHPDDAVNITLGLPIVRTSPAHGTARDIAGRGVASAESMRAALRLAEAIARRRASASALG